MGKELLDLNRKHVLITGASSGLGRAVALEMAGLGAHVSLLARRREQLEETATEARSRGGQALVLPADVTDQSSVDAAVKSAVEEFGPVEALVANAGISPNMSALEMDVPLITSTMQLNFFGVVYPVNAVLPSMIERKAGIIVAVSSVAAFRGLPTMSPYCASKSAVSAWIESLRSELDLKESGIRMVASHPGYIRTPMTEEEETNMPFIVEVEDAARIMVQGIRAGDAQINFPSPLIAMLKTASSLPNRLYDRVIWGSATNPVTWGMAARDACLWVAGGIAVFLAAKYSLTRVSESTAGTLRTVYQFGLPVLSLMALVVSKKLRKSIKVPILIVLMSVPLAVITALVRWLT